MSDYAERFTRVADGFGRRVDAVPAGAWEYPSPCEGWVARDIIRHLAEWVPGFLRGSAGLAFPCGPSVDDDPAGAWSNLRHAIDGHLADQAVATREFDAPMGRMSIEQAIDTGHFGPRIAVPEAVDLQTMLIAFVGRNPARVT